MSQFQSFICISLSILLLHSILFRFCRQNSSDSLSENQSISLILLYEKKKKQITLYFVPCASHDRYIVVCRVSLLIDFIFILSSLSFSFHCRSLMIIDLMQNKIIIIPNRIERYLKRKKIFLSIFYFFLSFADIVNEIFAFRKMQ